MDENRLIDIEMKLAHQEDMVNELNRVVTDQQSQIARLEQLCRSLVDRMRSMAEAAPDGNPADERPPHY